MVLEGRIAFFVFDDSGAILKAHLLGRGPGDALGIDLPPDTWHTRSPSWGTTPSVTR